MAELDKQAARSYGMGASRAGLSAIDEGLRAYMLQVYNYMAIGLAVTGIVALGMAELSIADTQAEMAAQLQNGVMLTSIGAAIYASFFKFIVIFAPLGMVFYLSARIGRMSTSGAQMAFWIFAALMGLSLTTIFFTYTGTSIARVFFITAASFGALSLYGYTTKKDLSGWGSFLIMGVFGILIAMVVNIFLQSSALYFAISVIGVLVFSGLTAYDTQQIKEMYSANDDGTMSSRKAIMGALRLYLDFINLFVMLLSLFGNRE